jgi:hypothetical protein
MSSGIDHRVLSDPVFVATPVPVPVLVEPFVAVEFFKLDEERQCARFHVLFEILPNVLVVDVELVFQRIQLGIAEDLPPFAAQHGIAGLCHLPAIATLRRFLVCRRRRLGGRGHMILGADGAAGQCSKAERGRGKGDGMSSLFHLHSVR